MRGTVRCRVPEAVIAVLVAVASGLFGWGVAWGTVRKRLDAAEERSGTAIDHAQDALGRIAVLSERQTRATGERRLLEERIRSLRDEVNILRRISKDLPDPEPVRDDSVPPIPPPRARFVSRRET